jgi:hypothetical protein
MTTLEWNWIRAFQRPTTPQYPLPSSPRPAITRIIEDDGLHDYRAIRSYLLRSHPGRGGNEVMSIHEGILVDGVNSIKDLRMPLECH